MAAETWRLPFFCLMGLLATAGLASAVQPDLSCFGLGFVSNGDGSNGNKQTPQQNSSRPTCPGGCGAIVPRVDIVREVGEQYEAFCIFDSTRIKAENVYFRTRIGSINERLTHKKVNDSAIALNMTHSEASKYVLQCMADNSWLCSRQVLVGYQPQDVENFTCISRNWKTLNCSWSVPDNPITVQYNLTYVVPGFLDTRNCPSSSKNWCFFPPESFHERDLVNMTIIAKNKKGVRQFNHIISQFSAVIPNEASGLVADVLGPHEVNVSWSLPHPIDAFPGNVIQELMYKITHYGDKPVLDDDWKMVDTWEVKIELFTSIKYYKVIDILSPYVEYQFRVRLHTGTGPIRENMWSRPATVSATTFATQPTKAPEITTGMFEVEDLRFNRNINVMWQELDPIDWNGPDFAYIVKIYNNQDNSLIKTSERTTVPYTKLQNLSRFIPYRLEIVPVNSNGPLAGENVQSSVVVPEMSLILDAPKSFRVIAYTNEESTTYGVRWQLQDQSADIKRATIYWCRQKQYENWCETKLHWRKVDNPTQGAVNLTELEQSTRYKFGVSLESNESSSGIKFISCVALYGTVPAAIETFKKTQVTPNSVTLAWNLDCRAESAVVQGFNISYCQVPTLNATMECSENTENYALVEGESETKYEVEGLHPHSHYHFSIATQTALGLSHWSKPVIATTQTDYPSGAPQDLRVNQTGREWVQMAWAPPLPKDRNGYIVEYRAWIDNNRFKKVTARMPITMWNITNLEAYADYTIDIKACTEGGRGTFLCGNSSARITIKTNIGVPKRIEFIEQPTNDELKWDGYDEQRCNGPHCTFELEYVINGTTRIHTISADHISTNIGDLNITCTDNEEETAIKLRPVGMDEDGQRLEGPWSDKQLSCFPPGSYDCHHVHSTVIPPLPLSQNSEISSSTVVVHSTTTNPPPPLLPQNSHTTTSTLISQNGLSSVSNNSQNRPMPVITNPPRLSENGLTSVYTPPVHLSLSDSPSVSTTQPISSLKRVGSVVHLLSPQNYLGSHPQAVQNYIEVTSPISTQYNIYPTGSYSSVPQFRRGNLGNSVMWLPVLQNSVVVGSEQLPSDNQELTHSSLSREQEQDFLSDADPNHTGRENSLLEPQTRNIIWYPYLSRNFAPFTPWPTNLRFAYPLRFATLNSFPLLYSTLRSPIASNDRKMLNNNYMNSVVSIANDQPTENVETINPSLTSERIHENIISQRKQNDHGRKQSMSSCPLLELMKAKGIQVSLNATSETFELNIKGQDNIFRLLQTDWHQLVASHEDLSNTPAQEDNQSDLVHATHNSLFVAVADAANPSTAAHTLMESTGNQNNLDASKSFFQSYTGTSTMPQTLMDATDNQDNSFDSSNANKELSGGTLSHDPVSEELFSQSTIIGLDLQSSDLTSHGEHTSSPVIDTLLSHDNESLDYNFSVEILNASTESGNTQDESYENTPINNATVNIEIENIKLSEVNEAPAALHMFSSTTESAILDLTDIPGVGNRSRRSIQLQPLDASPLLSKIQLSSSEQHQRDVSLTNSSIPVDSRLSVARDMPGNLETDFALGTILPVINETKEINDILISRVSDEHTDLLDRQASGPTQPKASVIYHLGAVGSFNGNIGIVSPLTEEEIQEREPAELLDKTATSISYNIDSTVVLGASNLDIGVELGSSDIGTTSSNSDISTTSGNSDISTTSSNSDISTTSGNSDISTSSNSDISTTSGNSDISTSGNSDISTSGNSDISTTSGNSDISTTSGNSGISTSGNSDISTTSGNSDISTTSSNSDISTTSGNSDISTTSSNSDISTTSSNSDISTTSSNSDIGTTSGNSDISTTSSNSDISTSSNSDISTTSGNSDISAISSNSESVTKPSYIQEKPESVSIYAEPEEDVINVISQIKTHSPAPCLMDTLNDEDVTVNLLSSNNEEFEINVQGRESLPALMKKLLGISVMDSSVSEQWDTNSKY